MNIDVDAILARNSEPGCQINREIERAVHNPLYAPLGSELIISAAEILCQEYDPTAISLPTKVYYPPHVPASWNRK